MKRAAAVGLVIAAATFAGGRAFAERRDQRTTVAIYRAVGGVGYGGSVAGGPSGAFISHRREVDIGAAGALRFPGVAAAMDAATVEVHSVTDPGGTSVVEQRFLINQPDPEALLARQVGKAVTVVLAQGEVRGTLRAVALDALVIETADGGLEIVRRGEHVVDIKLGAAGFEREPTLAWTLAVTKPGRQTLDVSYRTAGLVWSPEYTAVLDDGGVDFSAWATVRNDTGLDLTAAEVTLVTEAPAPVAAGLVAAMPRAAVAFKLARPVDLPTAQAMQVELVPHRRAVKTRRVAVFEAMLDQSQSFPNQDCYGYTPPASAVRTEQMIELDGPRPALPEGQVRVFRRAAGGGLTVIGEDVLRVNTSTGALRVHAGAAPELVGERRQVDCKLDPGGRSLRERIEVRVDNKSKQAIDVVVREYLYRWSNWRIEHEDHKGAKAGPTAQEWRVALAAGASQTLTYAVVYAW